MSDFIYDEETYPNVFLLGIGSTETSDGWLFEISERRNDFQKLVEFINYLKFNKARMVGYNNLHFDYPILHDLLTGKIPPIAELIYQKAMSIINNQNKFGDTIWDSDHIVAQVDLMKIHHFDNIAKATSLKALEFAMRMKDIRDLPFPVGTVLNYSQMDVLTSYMWHDITATRQFYGFSKPMIDFRDTLSAKYNRNFTNHNDTKIGKDYFIMELEKQGVPCYTRNHLNKRIPLQSHRPSINLGEVILPEVRFEQPAFNYVVNWLNNKTITKTKGVFEFIEVPFEMAKLMNPNLVKVHGLEGNKPINLSDCDLDGIDTRGLTFISGLKDKSGLNCIINGFQFDFGTGGIHGSVSSQTVSSDEEYVVYDWDVASYYPNLAIANNLYPEHLSAKFCTIYKDVYNQRKQFAKGTPENAMLKLALNGVYGDSNNQYSPFYDPKYTMTITINGQLLLCMLAEQLMKIPNLSMVQINTDGLTVKCPRIYVDNMKQMCKWWEQLTKLELESVEYSKMYIRDVNNYIAIGVDGKIKRKGAYCYKWHPSHKKDRDVEWHQNMSALVVPMAAEAALLRGEDIDTFIMTHKDDLDFMIRAKVPRSNNLLHGGEKIQGLSRYYVSHIGKELIRNAPPIQGAKVGQWKRKSGLNDTEYMRIRKELQNRPRQPDDALDTTGTPWDARINTKNRSTYTERNDNECKGWLTAIANSTDDINRNLFNYDYYINETKKLVVPVRGY